MPPIINKEKCVKCIEAIPFVKAGLEINVAIESRDLDGAIRLRDVPYIVAKSNGAGTVLVDIHPFEQLLIDSGIEESVADAAYPDLQDYGHTVGTKEETKEYFTTVINFLKENEIITNEVKLDDWLNTSFYENATK